MPLTAGQYKTLKTAIAADGELSTYPNNSDGNFAIAALLNQAANPAFVVWRTSVTQQQWRAAIIGGGGASQLDALTASKRDSLLWAISDMLNPSVAAVRAALDDFCGSQNTLKAAVLAAQKRNATRAEKIFATGTGSDATPATLGFEGTLSKDDVEIARNLP